MVANPDWNDLAIPGFVVTPATLYFTIVWAPDIYSSTVKNEKLWSVELNPSPSIWPLDGIFSWSNTVVKPSSPTLCTPSTNISSPTLNGWGSTNPLNGVCIKQTTKPCESTDIELIPIPFELLIANISCGTESKPWIGAINSTSAIVWLGDEGNNVESSIISFVIEFTRSKSGGVV